MLNNPNPKMQTEPIPFSCQTRMRFLSHDNSAMFLSHDSSKYCEYKQSSFHYTFEHDVTILSLYISVNELETSEPDIHIHAIQPPLSLPQ